MLYKFLPDQKTVCLLTTLLLGFTGSASGEEENIEEKRPILNRFTDGVGMVTRPVFTGEEREKGLFSTQWGPAHFRLSMLRGFELTFDDNPFTMKIGGRMYLDIVHYFNDKNDLGDNGFGMRTLQVDILGKLTQNWAYRFSVAGFTNGGRVSASGVALDDAFFRYLGFDHTVVTIGQQTEPFSLEQMTSSLNITFMERALPNAFAPGSTLGISAATGGERWFAIGGFYSKELSESKDQGSLGRGFTGNVSVTPMQNDYGVIHTGSSFSFRRVGDQREIFFRSRPESGITDVRFVNTGVIPGTKSLLRWGLDVVGIFGPWSIQGEYMDTTVGRKDDFENVGFHGWYTFLSWFPTGETRNYLENGIFGGIKPLNDYGAVELAVRFSSIDLNDKDITGGSEQNVTLGVNWYIHQQLRVMFNYIYVNTDANANDDGSVEGNDSPHVLQMRFQANF